MNLQKFIYSNLKFEISILIHLLKIIDIHNKKKINESLIYLSKLNDLIIQRVKPSNILQKYEDEIDFIWMVKVVTSFVNCIFFYPLIFWSVDYWQIRFNSIFLQYLGNQHNDRGERIDTKSNQWFGATVSSAGEDGPVVVSNVEVYIISFKFHIFFCIQGHPKFFVLMLNK